MRRSQGFSLLEVVVVVSVMAIIMAMTVPLMGRFRLNDDTRNLSNALSLAKLRAASNFSRARLFIDIAGGTHHIEWWRQTGVPGWVPVNGLTLLNASDSFGLASVAAPPPNTQPAAGQPAPCLDDMLNPIAGSACIVFNSRGIPVDAAGAPTNSDAVYVSDGTTVGAVTVSSAGLITTWSTPNRAVPTWSQK